MTEMLTYPRALRLHPYDRRGCTPMKYDTNAPQKEIPMNKIESPGLLEGAGNALDDGGRLRSNPEAFERKRELMGEVVT